MLQLKRVLGACILGLASLLSCRLASDIVPTAAVHAATYYVATTGRDSNPGTEKQPWRTVAHAVAAMVPGDTTYVRAGIYKEGLIRFRRSGTQTSPIKLLNAPGESPIIDCIDKTQFHRIILEHASGFQNPIGWIAIEGFEIRNCYNGIKMHNGHDVTIRRNWIHDNTPGSGILGNGTRVLIDRNVINHNADIEGCEAGTAPCKPGGHGIYANGTAWTFTNNLIYDNLTFGIQLNGSPSSFYNSSNNPGPEFAVSENWVIANNTLAYNRNGAGVVVWGSTCNNVYIVNNIFYANAVTKPSATQGVHFTSTTCTGGTIRNNIFYASSSGGTLAFGKEANEWVHYTQSGNIVNTMNPQFVNAPATLPVSPNFKLTAGSPAIDKGLSLALTGTAFDGMLRPQGRAYDIGAYEYTDGDDAQPYNGQ